MKKTKKNISQIPIRLAITMGDPAGIGPEIILKVFKEKAFPKNCIPVVVGLEKSLIYFRDSLNIDVEIKKVEQENINECYELAAKNIIPVIEPQKKNLSSLEIEIGKPTKESGIASFESILYAIRLIQKDFFDAVCTAPISKTALHEAGILFPGHTEILAYYSRTKNYAMLLEGGGLRVVLATIHIALKDVFKNLTSEKIISHLKLIKKFFKYYGIDEPRIGVAGLNPHAGEGGLFGSEESKIIEPAIELVQNSRIDARGPFPSDTIFFRMLEGDFDVILAMYHDQALIPIKTLDFYGGVNLTLGLPFIRTSPDHGTAFDKAGKNISYPNSLRAAINTACFLASNKKLLEK